MKFGNYRLNKVVAVALCAATFAGGLLPTVSVEAAIHRGQQQTQHERSARPQQDRAKAARPISAKSGESRQQTRQHRPEQKRTEQQHRPEQKKTEQQHRQEQKKTEQKHHQEQQRHEQERREEIRREEEAHRIAEHRREEELQRREERLRDRERELSYRERECYEDEDYCRRYHKHNNDNNDSIIKAVLGTILIGAVLNNAGIFDRGGSRHSNRNSNTLSVDYDEYEDEAEEILL